MLPPDLQELARSAREVWGEIPLCGNSSAGTCAAAIRSASGAVYSGICLDMACGIGFCAEHAAVAEMLKARETHFVASVALVGERIIPPCGRCRELFMQLDARNAKALVAVGKDSCRQLQELIPSNWLSSEVWS